MYGEISPKAAKRYSLAEFAGDYGKAQETATATQLTTGDPTATEDGGRQAAAVPVSFDTHAFGQISGRLVLPLAGDKVAWSPNLVFPSLGPGERLVRNARVPERAPILARDGTPLAEGPATSRSSPIGAAAQSVTGVVSSPSRQQDRVLSRLGFPPGAPTGTSGLELAFNRRLSGRPGGQLVAAAPGGGGPVLATSKPVPGKPVHTTIDPALQQAAVAALGGAVRRRRGARRSQRLGAGAGGHRVLRPAAAGLDLQADHDHRGARGRGGQAHGPVPDPDLDRGRRPRGRQRPQRSMRRELRRGLRGVVQQRLRAARAEDRLAAARRRGRAVRLQLAAQPLRPAGISDRGPAREHDPDLDPRTPSSSG